MFSSGLHVPCANVTFLSCLKKIVTREKNNNKKKPLTLNKSEEREKHESIGLFYKLQRFQTYLHPSPVILLRYHSKVAKIC